GRLAVLVQAASVVAEPLRRDQLLEVRVVEPVDHLRVVVPVGESHPRRLDLLPRRDVRVRHEMEGVEVELVLGLAHACSSMKEEIRSAVRSGCSTMIACPVPGTVSIRAASITSA